MDKGTMRQEIDRKEAQELAVKIQEQLAEKVKEIVRDGQASHISLKRKGETVFSISRNAGLIGALIGLKTAPLAVLTAALISFGLDCEIEIEKKDGTIINLNDNFVFITSDMTDPH